MNAVNQESFSPNSGDATGNLIALVENSIEELVAFGEIIAETPGRTGGHSSEWIDKNIQFMDDDTRNAFGDVLKSFAKMLGNVADQLERHEADPTKKPFEGASISLPSKEVGEVLTRFVLDHLYRMGNRAEMISRAFLVAAESSFEVLFGQLVRVVYAKNPSALPKSDYAFTLEELSNYASIHEVREALITRKIESLLHESLDEWAKWLKRTINISLDQIMSDWPVTREIFIRRNMLVHTDGRITERYLSELQRAGGSLDGLSVGQSLTPSVDYLRKSLQRLIALEVLLVFRVWSRVEKREIDEAAAWLSTKLEIVVLQEMWEAACLISDSFDDTQCKRSIQLAVKIGGWLAHKNRDGIDHIYEDVSAWDVSGLDERYTVIKKLLLNKLTDQELVHAIEKDIFSKFKVSTHPLFANIRQRDSLKLSALETSKTVNGT